MSILKIEPNAINSQSSFSFGNLTVVGNIGVGSAIISATQSGDIAFTTAAGAVEFNSNTVGFLSNVATEGPQGAVGYTGSRGVDGTIGVDGYTGSIGYTGSTGAGYTGSAGVGYTGSNASLATPYILTKTNSAATTIPASTTTQIALNTNVSGSSAIASTNGFTVLRDGLYDVNVVHYSNNSSQVNVAEMWALIYVNGVEVYKIYEGLPQYGYDKGLSGSKILQLAANNVITVYFWCFGATLTVSAQSVKVTVTELVQYAGYTGSSGTNGYTGSAGVDGTIGYTGSIGYNGSQGSIGYTGSSGSIGYTGSAALNKVALNEQTTSYQLILSDVGKYINITTGGVTVTSGVFSSGDVVSIYNNSSSSQTITQGASVTMYQVGTATTGNRTLAQRGLATILCVGTNEFVITGGGLT